VASSRSASRRNPQVGGVGDKNEEDSVGDTEEEEWGGITGAVVAAGVGASWLYGHRFWLHGIPLL
jgi:hypothetical protein